MIEVNPHPRQPMADFAAELHRKRQDEYPAQVAAGRMTQEDADAGIARMSALAHLWQCACECRMPDPAIAKPELLIGLATDLHSWRERIIVALIDKPESAALERYLENLTVLLDWHRRYDEGPIWMVQLTLESRAQIAAEAQRNAA